MGFFWKEEKSLNVSHRQIKTWSGALKFKVLPKAWQKKNKLTILPFAGTDQGTLLKGCHIHYETPKEGKDDTNLGELHDDGLWVATSNNSKALEKASNWGWGQDLNVSFLFSWTLALFGILSPFICKRQSQMKHQRLMIRWGRRKKGPPPHWCCTPSYKGATFVLTSHLHQPWFGLRLLDLTWKDKKRC